MNALKKYWFLVAFLGSLTGGFVAWRIDMGSVHIVQSAQAETLAQHTVAINSFVSRIPVIEEKIDDMKERIVRIENSVINKEK